MFSVILYGRNASHGYILHKRAAIGLNALAQVMSDADDEILFVDDNTPNGHPTFPEAIHNPLTDKARSVTRILRVRPRHRLRVAARPREATLESQSRNVAVRRSNPRNRWCVSATTDTLLVPRDESRDHIGANITPFCSQILAGDPRAAAPKKGRFLRLRRQSMA